MMDHHQKLIAHIKQDVPLTAADEAYIIKHFKVKTLKKKEILLFKGETSHHMRYIAKGCMRNYQIDENGHERILQFGIENWWLNDMYSFITKTPARFFVQAIEDSVLLQIQRDDLEQLFKEAPIMERFLRLKIQSGYVALQDRMIDNMTQTAEERYLEFRKKYRAIEQRVPQYMVASFLGITPEFLSTIRKKLPAD
jgi:CRP/FNR family transcriptional regulator, anaerobic regulatory protein